MEGFLTAAGPETHQNKRYNELGFLYNFPNEKINKKSISYRLSIQVQQVNQTKSKIYLFLEYRKLELLDLIKNTSISQMIFFV